MKIRKLDDHTIEQAKKLVKYSTKTVVHEHNDCVRMAYQWLDAQKLTINKTTRQTCIKHRVESWCARYVSTNDVEVAALLHPDIEGIYPYYNISKVLVLPSFERLKGIGEAGKHAWYSHHQSLNRYRRIETIEGYENIKRDDYRDIAEISPLIRGKYKDSSYAYDNIFNDQC